ncbi:hypothetical protein VP02_00175 [Pseudomonas ogarae]|uniref:Uncharacterized protein n=1 Tax=Pseudomonas kilonensis TaxID=132476 RepID=A0A0F4XVC0_9PSED|nr:hypothetical protein VP02_00175 [Pseudomonas ogarae]
MFSLRHCANVCDSLGGRVSFDQLIYMGTGIDPAVRLLVFQEESLRFSTLALFAAMQEESQVRPAAGRWSGDWVAQGRVGLYGGSLRAIRLNGS